MAQQQGVYIGHQGCALTAGGHITAAEVGDHGATGALRDDSGAAQLQGRRSALHLRRNVPYGLPVIADEIDLRKGQVCSFGGFDGSLGVNLAQAEVQLAQQLGAAGFRAERAEDILPQVCRHIQRNKGKQFIGNGRRRAFDAQAGSIHAVSAGAAHNADADHRPISSRSMAQTISSTMLLRTLPRVRQARPA